MGLADLCIQRPIFTLMLMLSIVVFGALGFSQLGIDQMPNMEFPIVSVTATLEGASPEVMEEDVTEVLEDYINTIGGLRSLTSTTFHGATQVIAEFDLDREIDQAAQDVRDKIAAARRELPRDLDPPVVNKLDPGQQPIIWIPISSERPVTEATDYLRYTVKPYIETIDGVASTELFGRRERAIRIWLDGDALRARGMSASDVIRAVQREHVDIPAGQVTGRSIEYSLKTDAEFRSVEALARLVVTHIDGAVVRLEDVARVEDGAEDERVRARFNGAPSVGLGVRKQAQGNTVAIADQTRERIEALAPLTPAGITLPEWGGVMDFSIAIRESVRETMFALWFGALLATLTVLAFLRRFRATLIVGLAIPLSLIGTFGVMWLLGYTLNTMTLLALALAVGVVIDDAIVVLENIERHRESGETPYEASSKGTREIAFAATAATLSIAVVFLPVVFVDGIVGAFLAEFGATVASAVMISLFIALTLVPMLAARISAPSEQKHGGLYHRLENGFLWLESHYRTLLFLALERRKTVLAIAVGALALAGVMGSRLGAEFFPAADEGRMFVMMQTPPGTSLDGTSERLQMVERWVRAQPEVKGALAGIGTGGSSGPAQVTTAVLVSILVSRNERERSAQDLMKAAREYLATIPGLDSQVFDPSTFSRGGGGAGELEFHVRGNIDLDQLDELSDEFMRRLAQVRGVVDLKKSLKVGLPEVRIVPDREKAAALGIDAANLAQVVQATIGGLDIAKFKDGGHRYDVRVRFEEDARDSPDKIGKVFLRTKDGDVVELRNVAAINTGAAPSTVTRYDRMRAVTISMNLEDLTAGTAIAKIRELGTEILPDGVTISFSGSAEQFLDSIRQFGLAIGLATLVIYMLLAAQFESLLHPLTVMLALPLAMVGALGGLLAMGMTINMFSLIGILLLFGLVTKNSILVVDYANQLRERGMDKLEAMKTAAPVRMRPVLMTAISMIFGVLPAATGLGPGSETRAPMAVATAAGMFSSTLLTLLVVPVFYLVLDDLVEWARSKLGGSSGSDAANTGGAATAPTRGAASPLP